MRPCGLARGVSGASIRLAELLLLPLWSPRGSGGPRAGTGATVRAASLYQLWWDMVAPAREAAPRCARCVVRRHWRQHGRGRGDRYAGYGPRTAMHRPRRRKCRGSLIRHEMLHALTRNAGHPRAAFLRGCGGVVVCDQRCIAEAGSLPPLDASVPRVGSDLLEVDVVVTPQTPSLATYGGWFTMTITARNPWNNPIAVRLTPAGDGGPASASYQSRAVVEGRRRRPRGRLTAERCAGETKRRSTISGSSGPRPRSSGWAAVGTYAFIGRRGQLGHCSGDGNLSAVPDHAMR